MLDSVEKDNKTISQMYKGNELVWEMPKVGLEVNNLGIRSGTISGFAYPEQCDIKILIENPATNKHVEYDLKNYGFTWKRGIKPLNEGDKVTVTANADGWIGTSFDDTIF